MINQKDISSAGFSIEQLLAAYKEVVEKFGYAPICDPGKIHILGWDLEYVCGSALASFIDQILIRRLNDFIPDNEHPLIFDCGANIGFSVLNYKRQFPNAKIIAFEPDPQFVPVLRRNLECNGAGDVEVVESAVWIKNGEAKWFCEGIDGSKIIESADESLGTVDVRTIDLADFLNQDVDLLKLDIEGAEYEVILHLGDNLRFVKNILVESHIDQNTIVQFAEMVKALKEAGFNIGINSFGSWRDLIRQTEILPHHWGQYLLVAGWRSVIPRASKQYSSLPYVGKELLEKETLLQEIQQQYQEIQQQYQVLKQHNQEVQQQYQQLQQEALQFPDKIMQYIQWLNATEYNGDKFILEKPFNNEQNYCWIKSIPEYITFADNEFIQASQLILFENDKELGPAHALHYDIRNQGDGLYSHWQDTLYFSTSDNSDPNENGRTYRVLVNIDQGSPIEHTVLSKFLQENHQQSKELLQQLQDQNQQLLQEIQGLKQENLQLQQQYQENLQQSKELQQQFQEQTQQLRGKNLLLAEKYKGKKVELKKPFIYDGKHCWIAILPQFKEFADGEFSMISPLVLFEDKKELGPGHASQDDIRDQGGGKFSHWMDTLRFSTSDNTDPNMNGRKYWVYVNV